MQEPGTISVVLEGVLSYQERVQVAHISHDTGAGAVLFNRRWFQLRIDSACRPAVWCKALPLRSPLDIS